MASAKCALSFVFGVACNWGAADGRCVQKPACQFLVSRPGHPGYGSVLDVQLASELDPAAEAERLGQWAAGYRTSGGLGGWLGPCRAAGPPGRRAAGPPGRRAAGQPGGRGAALVSGIVPWWSRYAGTPGPGRRPIIARRLLIQPGTCRLLCSLSKAIRRELKCTDPTHYYPDYPAACLCRGWAAKRSVLLPGDTCLPCSHTTTVCNILRN